MFLLDKGRRAASFGMPLISSLLSLLPGSQSPSARHASLLAGRGKTSLTVAALALATAFTAHEHKAGAAFVSQDLSGRIPRVRDGVACTRPPISPPSGTRLKATGIATKTRSMCSSAASSSSEGGRGDTLGEMALRVLTESDPKKKMQLSNEAASAWQSADRGSLSLGSVTPPDRPARPEWVEVVDWNDAKLPNSRRKKSSEAEGDPRLSLLHAIAHIESYAIDLSWDIVARFRGMPEEFYDDWVQVAKEETLHFGMLSERLEELGSHYGAIPTHDGLWTAASITKDDIRERLAIVHMVHEARGVDVTPNTINKFKSSHDFDTAKILERIYVDELTHVGKGIKWFKWVCEQEGETEPVEHFKRVVTSKFGFLKGPFNDDGRGKAGMPKDWYEPLVKDFQKA